MDFLLLCWMDFDKSCFCLYTGCLLNVAAKGYMATAGGGPIVVFCLLNFVLFCSFFTGMHVCIPHVHVHAHTF